MKSSPPCKAQENRSTGGGWNLPPQPSELLHSYPLANTFPLHRGSATGFASFQPASASPSPAPLTTPSPPCCCRDSCHKILLHEMQGIWGPHHTAFLQPKLCCRLVLRAHTMGARFAPADSCQQLSLGMLLQSNRARQSRRGNSISLDSPAEILNISVGVGRSQVESPSPQHLLLLNSTKISIYLVRNNAALVLQGGQGFSINPAFRPGVAEWTFLCYAGSRRSNALLFRSFHTPAILGAGNLSHFLCSTDRHLKDI